MDAFLMGRLIGIKDTLVISQCVTCQEPIEIGEYSSKKEEEEGKRKGECAQCLLEGKENVEIQTC